MKKVILVGGGGHCKSVIEAIVSTDEFCIEGILDSEDKVGESVLDYKIIGTDNDIEKYAKESLFIITVGHIKDSSIRQRIANKIDTANGKYATVIASTANVSRYAKLGEGSVVLHSSMVNAGAIIGKHTIINTLANIEHDSIIGDFCHISTGSMINGNCIVERDVFMGSQSVLMNGASVKEGSIISAGSFVRKSINNCGIYAGNPAIIMKKL